MARTAKKQAAVAPEQPDQNADTMTLPQAKLIQAPAPELSVAVNTAMDYGEVKHVIYMINVPGRTNGIDVNEVDNRLSLLATDGWRILHVEHTPIVRPGDLNVLGHIMAYVLVK